MAQRQLPSLPKMRKDAVTRRLCASVHLDADFAFALAGFTAAARHVE